MPAADPRRPLSADDLWKLHRVGAPAPAPDGSFVVVGVTTYDLESNKGTERLYRVPADGGEPRPLTSADASSGSPAVSPDGRAVAFLRSPPGQDRAQLHVLPLDGGEARRLTDLPLGVQDLRWLPSGEGLVVLAPLYRAAMTAEGTRHLAEERGRDPVKAHVTEDKIYRFWDRWLTDGEVSHLFLVDARTGEARDLTPDFDQWFDPMDPSGQLDVSPDGAEVAFAANATPPPYDRARSAVYTVPVAGGAVACLTPDNPSDDVRPRYSPDGRWLVYGSRRDGRDPTAPVVLARRDRSDGAEVALTEGWDRSAGEWEFAGPSALVVQAEERGRVALLALDVAAARGAPAPLCAEGSSHAPRPAADGRVYVQNDTLLRPPEVCRVPLSGGPLERLTRFNDALLAEVRLGDVEEVELPGAGGDPVQVFLVFPPGIDRSRPQPLLQLVHGGPHGCFGDQWHFRWNAHALAGATHVTAMVNFHGSSSFGHAFARSINGDWGGRAAEDVMLATDHLVARGVADPARLALAGGSFGGYMTCWLAARTDRFACAIAHASCFDLRSMCATDVTQEYDVELGGAPWELPRDAGAVERFNPAAFASGYRTPMLVTHGEQDFRCPVDQSLALYGVLKARGVPARLVHYPDENHWILKPRNSLHWYGEFRAWLQRWCPPPG